MLAIKSKTCFFLVENFPSYFGRASLIHGTERAGTDRFRVLFHGTDLQSSKVTNLIGIKATLEFHCAFAGAASRMVEETLCNRADDGCKGIIT